MKNPLYKLDLQFFSEQNIITPDSLKKLADDFKSSWTELKGLMDVQADEMRKHGDASSQTAAAVKKAEEKHIALEADLKAIREELKGVQAQANRLPFGGAAERKSIGAQFIESDAYKSASEKGIYSTDAFTFKSFYNMNKKDIDSTDANGGLLAGTMVLPGVFTAPNEQLRLRDVLNVQETNAPSIEYIEEQTFLNAAGPVAEKALKPQSDLTFVQRTAQVRTIAHFLPATRQILQDAPQLQNIINSRLQYGLKLVEEAQVLFGSGTGENLLGLMNHTGVQDVGARPADVTMIDWIRRAITRAVLAGYPVTAIILHPEDWEAIELAKGGDGHYIFTSVNTGGEMRLFRVPVIESTSMAAGSFLLGAFGLACQILDRMQSTIRISDSHSDYFARNMTAILCEERIALPVYRPSALVKGSFTPPATV